MNGVLEPGLEQWQQALAAGLVSGDVSAAGIARAAHIPVDTAQKVLDEATAAGLLVDGQVVDEHASQIVASLDQREVDQVHADTALHLLTLGPEHAVDAIAHARAAGTADQSDLLRLLSTSGRMLLATGDGTTASTLLGAAVELGDGDDAASRARLRFDLARALDCSGRTSDARDELLEVIRLASAAGEHELVVDAAIRSVFPPDWRAGDRRAAAVLDLAEQAVGDGPRAAGLLAARAMVEMRLPASEEQGHQVGWVTRTAVAQPLAVQAVALTDGATDGDRLAALTAWRQTHRGPQDLERRLTVAEEALQLAQRLHDHERLTDAAVAASIDRMEAGDRAGRDEAVAILRWLAASEGSPRIRWWNATIGAGVAMHDGDEEQAAQLRADAQAIGAAHDLPGWLSAEILLSAEAAVDADDVEELGAYVVAVNTPLATSPVARSMVVWATTRVAQLELARQHARVARRTVDDQQSLLLCCTLLARAASRSGDGELATFCAQRLTPWADRVAVDGAGWWCHGPVALALAELALGRGAAHDAAAHLHAAQVLIDATGDVRAERRAAAVRRALADGASAAAGDADPIAALRAVPGVERLTEREQHVLALMADGRTNAEIADALSFSASTIRVDTMSIYRKLGVHGRVDAVALVASAGLPRRADRP